MGPAKARTNNRIEPLSGDPLSGFDCIFKYFAGEFLGASLDRPWADGAAGDPLPHARQHLHQRHRALAQVGPGQRATGMSRTMYTG